MNSYRKCPTIKEITMEPAATGKSIAIVSSWREACGPAAHTLYLEIALKSLGHAVTVLPIDISLTTGSSKFQKRANRAHIRDLIAAGNRHDACILQIEPGLYGAAPWRAYRTINKMIGGLKNPTVVIHGMDRPSLIFSDLLFQIKSCFAFGARDQLRYFWSQLALRFSSDYRRFLNNLRKCGKVICFSKFDVSELKNYWNIETKFIPISYLLQDDVDRLRSSHERLNAKMRSELKITQNFVVVMPGFINDYKNPLAAMEAARHLDRDKFAFVYAGGVHPRAKDDPALIQFLSKSNQASDYKTFIGKGWLQDNVTEFPSNVYFTGNISDENLNEYIAGADLVVLPYKNTVTGQSGSGPFAFAMEIAQKALFSKAKVFQAQDLFSPTFDFSFDTANPVELAQKIDRAKSGTTEFPHYREKYRERNTAELQAREYVEIMFD